jgi:hypothetical protein
MLHCGCPSTYSEHCITMDDIGGDEEYTADDDIGIAEDIGAEEL